MNNTRCIAVIDLKAFYSYVECVDRGLDPWTTPLVVADKSRSKNTIVLSVTPYLKSLGIPSRLRIGDLPKEYKYIYATPRMSRYLEKSTEVIDIIYEFLAQEDVFVYSIDEAFLDLTSYLNYYNMTPLEIVKMIMARIKEKTGLQATGGISENFFLSKIALDIYAKHEPDGIATFSRDDIPSKLWTIEPLSKIWGIGPRLEERLNQLGIKNCYQLAHANLDFIKKHFGIMGEQLVNMANGIDEADMHEEYVPKERSFSIGQVLFRDYDYKEITTIIREMCDDLSLRLRNERKKTAVVSLFIGYAKEVDGGFSRQMSLLTTTDDTKVIFEALMEIYNKFIEDKPIRRVGLSFGKLTKSKTQQLNLFMDQEKQIQDRDLQKAMDYLKNKYGKDVVLRGSALLEESTAKERHSFIGGHKK